MNNSNILKKKILIISSWAPPMIGGPQNLYNLFAGIQSDSYSILTSSKVREAIQNNIAGTPLATNYYFADDYSEGVVVPTDVQSSDPSALRRKNGTSITRIIKYIQKIPFFGPRLLSLVHIVVTIRAYHAGFQKASAALHPTMLLGISDTGIALLATYWIAKKTHLPFGLYLFDLYQGNLLPSPYKLLAKILEPKLVKQASVVIVTNEETEAYYKRRYGNRIQTTVIHNATFPEAYEAQRTPYTPKPPFTITFTGNIYWAQEQAVQNLIRAMAELQDLPLTLQLYCPQPPESIRKAVRGKSNIWLGAATQSEMPGVQSASSLLFLPLAWNTQAPDIVATATPGKFTDYLASGRPMLIHAPKYAYVSKYSREHDLGIVVDDNNPRVLAEAIRRFLSNPAAGKKYVENALRIFHQNHDARKNAKKLTKILNLV